MKTTCPSPASEKARLISVVTGAKSVHRDVEKLAPLRSAWCRAHRDTRAVIKRLVV